MLTESDSVSHVIVCYHPELTMSMSIFSTFNVIIWMTTFLAALSKYKIPENGGKLISLSEIYIPSYFRNYPSVYKFISLLNTDKSNYQPN